MAPSYLAFVSLFLLPTQMIILALLSIGVARKQIHFVVEKVINVSVNVNGIIIKLYPTFALMSLVSMFYIYLSLVSL